MAPRYAAALLVAAALMNARTARADAQACTAAADEGQKLRATTKLRAARAKLLECATQACPTIVSADCAKWASEIAEMMPTIIIDARDVNLHDVGDVTVIVDGETVAEKLDGKAIAVDPGPHTLVFHRAGSAPIIERVIIKEGARGRTFNVRFGAAGTGSIMTPPAAASDEGPVRQHTTLPWVVIGIGGFTIVTGVVLLVLAPALPRNCDKASGVCTIKDANGVEIKPSPGSPAAIQLGKDQDTAGLSVGLHQAGLITLIVGSGIAAGGLVWHFLEPTGPVKAATITPWATDSGAGIVTRGTF